MLYNRTMKLDKALRRDYKHNKKKHGMKVTNRNIFILEKIKKDKADKEKKK